MNQLQVITNLVDWLQKELPDGLETRCDHVTPDKEELALYIGPKKRGKGRGSRIAQPDILVLNTTDQTVRLIVEVDPVPAPKKLLGNILAVLLADNYTPSNQHFPNQYKIQDCVVIFLTELEGQAGSQKARQFELIGKAISEKLDHANLGVKAIRLCFGKDDAGIVAGCQAIIREYFSTR